MKRVTVLLLVGILAPLACGDDKPPSTKLDCDGAGGPVTIEVASGEGRSLDGDLELAGSVRGPSDVAIRSVFVAGTPAERGSFNYGTWTATVPFQRLTQLHEPGSTEVSLDLRAVDACGREFTATKALRIPVAFETLDANPSFPGGSSYLPADGTSAVTVRVTANADAAGRVVRVEASTPGTLTNLRGDLLTLTGDGTTPAEGVFDYRPAGLRDGVATLTISGGGQATTVTVPVASPPSLLPSQGTVVAGQSLRVSVVSRGEVRGCSALTPLGVQASSGGQDISAAEAAVDDNDDGYPDIVIAVAEELAAAALVTISCRDVHGQQGTARFTATPATTPAPAP